MKKTRKLEKGYPPCWLVYRKKEYYIFPSFDKRKQGYWLNIRDADKNGNIVLRRFWKVNGWIVGDDSALHREVTRLLSAAGI